MIKIVKPDKEKNCDNCKSQDNVKLIIFGDTGAENASLALCKGCRNHLCDVLLAETFELDT